MLNIETEYAEIAAENIYQQVNPDAMTLEELRKLKTRVEAILAELWKMSAKTGFMSLPMRSGLTLRRARLEQFLARVNDLIQAGLSFSAYVQVAKGSEECQNHPVKLKL